MISTNTFFWHPPVEAVLEKKRKNQPLFLRAFSEKLGMGHFQKIILFKTIKFISQEIWETKSRFYRTKLKKKYIFESICYVWPLWFIIGKLKTLFSNGENVSIYEKRISLISFRKCQKWSFLTAWSNIELKFNSFLMENRFWPKLLMFLCLVHEFHHMVILNPKKGIVLIKLNSPPPSL